jgi:hypothetical protein
MKEKRVFDVLDANFLRFKNDPDDIESEGVARLLEARYPDLGGSTELALLSPIDGAHGATEIVRRARLNLDERHGSPGPLALRSGRDQIDVPAPISKPSLSNLPTMNRKPSLGDSLALASHELPRC